MTYELHDLFFELAAQEAAENAALTERIKKRTREKMSEGAQHTLFWRGGRACRPLLSVLVLLAVLLTACGAAVVAEQVFGLRLFDAAARDALQQPEYATVTAERTDPAGQNASESAAKILLPEYLGENEVFHFRTAGTIGGSGEEDGSTVFPAFVFDNGDVAILTAENGSGWKLQARETLTIRFAQNTADNPNAEETGSKMELGIVVNGHPQTLITADGLETEYTFTAEKAGTCYFYLKNYASNAIIVEGAVVA